MKLNIATILTISRIAFIPLISLLFIWDDGKYRDISAYIFLLALISDLSLISDGELKYKIFLLKEFRIKNTENYINQHLLFPYHRNYLERESNQGL